MQPYASYTDFIQSACLLLLASRGNNSINFFLLSSNSGNYALEHSPYCELGHLDNKLSTTRESISHVLLVLIDIVRAPITCKVYRLN